MQPTGCVAVITVWELTLRCKHSDTLVTATAVGNRLSFVSDPGILPLLAALMELWQANFLACQWGESQTLHNSGHMWLFMDR